MTHRQKELVNKFTLNWSSEYLSTALDVGPAFGFDEEADHELVVALHEAVERLADSLAVRAGREVSEDELRSSFKK